MLKILTSVLVFILLQACVAYPKQTFRKDYKRCDLVSREYHLAMNHSVMKVLMEGTGNPLHALVLSGIVAGVTTVVSGSIVIVGNTVHFLEKQGSCDDSFLNVQVLSHIMPLLEDGGELMDEDMIINTQSSEVLVN
jgi:hypothetical protein